MKKLDKLLIDNNSFKSLLFRITVFFILGFSISFLFTTFDPSLLKENHSKLEKSITLGIITTILIEVLVIQLLLKIV